MSINITKLKTILKHFRRHNTLLKFEFSLVGFLPKKSLIFPDFLLRFCLNFKSVRLKIQTSFEARLQFLQKLISRPVAAGEYFTHLTVRCNDDGSERMIKLRFVFGVSFVTQAEKVGDILDLPIGSGR